MVDILSKQTGVDVKAKVLSAWNRLKYSKNVFNIDTRATFTENSPVWLLSKPYHRRRRRQQTSPSSPTDDHDCLDDENEQTAFEADFRSRLWFTYRRNIDTFRGTQLTSDCGWGCMIRSGQMMFGQALLLHHLGRDWVWTCGSNSKAPAVKAEERHREIVRLFLDHEAAPLSIHNILRMGAGSGKRPGDWFGPGSVAHLIQMAVLRSQQGGDDVSYLLSHLAVYVAQDCTVYKEDVINICTAQEGIVSRGIDIQHDFHVLEPESLAGGDEAMSYSFSQEVTADDQLPWCIEQESSTRSQQHQPPPVVDPGWRSLVIFVPVRLGGEAVNPAYAACLRLLLSLPSCLGWIGGRPRHSLYFVGFQETDLIHLDPHVLQERVDGQNQDFPLGSFHCSTPRKIASSRMDPSCCLGFYLRTRDEFEAWCEGISDFCTPPSKGKGGYPLFVVCEGTGEDTTAYVTTGKAVQKEEEAEAGSRSIAEEELTETDEFVFL